MYVLEGHDDELKQNVGKQVKVIGLVSGNTDKQVSAALSGESPSTTGSAATGAGTSGTGSAAKNTSGGSATGSPASGATDGHVNETNKEGGKSLAMAQHLQVASVQMMSGQCSGSNR